MKPDTGTRLKIIEAAATAAATVGLGELTVGEVAKAAGVSSGLVHYHFNTKETLILAAVERAVAEDTAAVTRALATGPGLATLDHLWEAMTARARSGRTSFVLEVRVRAARSPGLAALTRGGSAAAIGKRLPALLRELGSRLVEPQEEIAAAVAVFLDGLALALAGGRDSGEVRAAYDAFWLALIAAGQGGQRR